MSHYLTLIAIAFLMTWTVSCGSRPQEQLKQSEVEDLPFEQVVPDGWENTGRLGNCTFRG